MRIQTLFFLFTGLAVAQTAASFTATEVHRTFDSDGNVRAETRFLFATNKDGSVASVDLNPDAMGRRQILDNSSQLDVLIDPPSKTATVLHRTISVKPLQNRCDDRFRKMNGAVVTRDAAWGMLQGVAVERISVTAGSHSFEVFAAPSLGCQILRSVLDPGGAARESTVTESLILGEPDTSLFEIPKDYRVSVISTR